MKTEEFSLLLGDIRDDFVARAHEPVRSRRAVPGWRRWRAAACLCLVTVAVLLASQYLPANADGQDNSAPDTIINMYQYEEEACYKAPDPGEYFCFIEVNKAREHYAGQEVKFLLRMDVFRNGESVGAGRLGGEFKRLGALGYDLRLVNLQEQDGDLIITWPIVVGLFTEEQLQNFPTDPAYGYTFSFPTDLDGSPISLEGLSAVNSLE